MIFHGVRHGMENVRNVYMVETYTNVRCSLMCNVQWHMLN